MAGSTLKISGLTRRYGGLAAVQDASFLVPAGSLTAVAGPAGSGKSTLIRVLAGLERGQAGTVELDGEAIGNRPAHRRGFGVVQQPDRLFAHLSLAENVALPLRLRGVKRAARQALLSEALELAQLGAVGAKRPREASPDEIQRALLARAAVFGPTVMLLDEPFGGADDPARLALIASLGRIHQMLGATILLATRSLRDALPLCSQVVVLRQGRVEQAGTPEEVFNRPDSDFVAGLCGETNRLPGIVTSREDDIATVQLACGPLVEARGGPALTAGSACTLVLRPEHIALAPVPAAEMGEGALDATLLETQFWGDSYRLRLLIGSGAEIVVRRPAIAGLRGLAPGRQAAIAWQSHHAMAFGVTASP